MTIDTLREGAMHPAPERSKASLWSLSFSLAAPPVAWSIQSIVGYAVSSEACYPGDSPRAVPVFAGMWELLLGINIGALAVGLLGVFIAYGNWRATRHELGGDSQHLIEGGEGRTRFLAMGGILVAVGFVTATAFTTVALVLAPICR